MIVSPFTSFLVSGHGIGSIGGIKSRFRACWKVFTVVETLAKLYPRNDLTKLEIFKKLYAYTMFLLALSLRRLRVTCSMAAALRQIVIFKVIG